MRARIASGLLSAVLIVSAAQASPLFRIADVGQAGNGGVAAVNEKSQVLANNAVGRNYVWTDGVAKDVSLYPDANFDMNDKGKVVGLTLNQEDFTTTPVYWPKAGKSPHALPSLMPGGSGYDRVTGVNTAGQMVGWLYDGVNSGPAYWDSNGALVDIGNLVEPHCYLFPNYPKINDKGMIALSSCDHGYKVDAASLTVVELFGFDTKHAFPCNDCSAAYGINDQNVVVGTSQALFKRPDGSTGVRSEATLWTKNSKPKDIGVLRIDSYPDVNSYAFAINSDSWVVGDTHGAATQRPFLWTPDMKIIDLNDLIDPADPKFGLVTLLSAAAINNKGEIVGVLADSTLGGELRLFKLTRSN